MEEETRLGKKERRKCKTAEMCIGKRYSSMLKALPFATSGRNYQEKKAIAVPSIWKVPKHLVETITNEMLSTKGLSPPAP